MPGALCHTAEHHLALLQLNLYFLVIADILPRSRVQQALVLVARQEHAGVDVGKRLCLAGFHQLLVQLAVQHAHLRTPKLFERSCLPGRSAPQLRMHACASPGSAPELSSLRSCPVHAATPAA